MIGGLKRVYPNMNMDGKLDTLFKLSLDIIDVMNKNMNNDMNKNKNMNKNMNNDMNKNMNNGMLYKFNHIPDINNKFGIMYQLVDYIKNTKLYNKLNKLNELYNEQPNESSQPNESRQPNESGQPNRSKQRMKGGVPTKKYLLLAHGSYPLRKYRDDKVKFIIQSDGYTAYLCDIDERTSLTKVKRVVDNVERVHGGYSDVRIINIEDINIKVIVFPPGKRMLNLKCEFKSCNSNHQCIPMGLLNVTDDSSIEATKTFINKYPRTLTEPDITNSDDNYMGLNGTLPHDNLFFKEFINNSTNNSTNNNSTNIYDSDIKLNKSDSLLIVGNCRVIRDIPQSSKWYNHYNNIINKIVAIES